MDVYVINFNQGPLTNPIPCGNVGCKMRNEDLKMFNYGEEL